jgi:hypothetical protein
MEEFDHAVDIACNVDAFIEQDDSTVRCDKETNTEGMYSDRYCKMKKVKALLM